MFSVDRVIFGVLAQLYSVLSHQDTMLELGLSGYYV